MNRSRPFLSLLFAFVTTTGALGQAASPSSAPADEDPRLVEFIESYCLACHDQGTQEAGLALDPLLEVSIAENARPWEAIVRKLASRQMPPVGEFRPDDEQYDDVVARLATQLDRFAAERPNPGRTNTFRRLNRTEYQNSIRDLLGLTVDVTQWLPSDEASHGFDNVTVTNLSPVLLDRYVTASQQISRLAIGTQVEPAAETTYRIRPDITQDVHIAGTPIGTRGGRVIRHNFPQDGQYEVQVWLMRDRNEELEGMRGSHKLEVLLDRAPLAQFTIEPPPAGSSDKVVDSDLTARFSVSGGPHDVAIVFRKNPTSLLESVRQPLNVHFNYYRHPRIEPAIYQITVRGPFSRDSNGETPSRRRLYVCGPLDDTEEAQVACAEQIISNVARRAYRRDISPGDLEPLMGFFHEGYRQGGFDVGIQRALSAVLVNPQFLFRIERDPPDMPSGTAYRISALELASRLSFFLWSSIPDDELLQLAIDGRLPQTDVLEAQVQRMLSDERSESLVTNFAAQWLYLRNLDSVVPDKRLFPDFDDNLRQGLRRETELFFQDILRDDRSVLDLIHADYTYLNERLAKHYQIPHVYGSRFRRVSLDAASHRGGLLRHGSILTVTSYATRTSPVIRGHWVLKNLLGSPPPPPPPDVPELEDNTVSATLSVRARLEQHRANEVCARCHNLIDPVGFALENFDAVGRWRETENGEWLSSSGGLPDGSRFDGVGGLEQAILRRPELFVTTLAEKLMTYALGRGIEYYDAPAVRRIVREAEGDNYRFSSIIMGIVRSEPFQMRNSE